MGRKIGKIIGWIVATLLALVILAPVLLYLPPVQDLIRRKALPAVSEMLGMDLSVGKLRLRFPLRIRMEEVAARTAPGDTLFYAGRLRTSVALLPLIRREVVVRRFELEHAVFNYADTAGTFVLRGRLGRLALRVNPVRLKKQEAEIAFITLDSARVEMLLGESADTTAPAPIPPWKIELGKLEINGLDFRLTMDDSATLIRAVLPGGVVRRVEADLGTQAVSVREVALNDGAYSYLQDTLRIARTAAGGSSGESATADTVAVALPWEVAIGSVRLARNAFDFGVANGRPAPGLDFDHLRLTAIELSADSVYYRDTDIRARVSALSFRERSGLEVRSLTARVSVDTAYYRVEDLILKTASTELTADAVIGTSIADLAASTPVQATVRMHTGTGELLTLYPQLDATIRRALQGRTLTLDGDVDGRLADLSIRRLRLAMPGHFTVGANGRVRSLPDVERLAGELTLTGDFQDLEFLRPLVPDTALRNRIGLPPMTLRGSVRSAGGTIEPDLVLTVLGTTPAPATDYGMNMAVPVRADSLWAARAARFSRRDTLGTDDSAPQRDTTQTFRRAYRRPSSSYLVSDAGDTIRLRPPLAAERARWRRRPASPGTLSVAGSFNVQAQTYDARVVADSLPIYRFLPKDSLGLVSLRLTARGGGFDPFDAATDAVLSLRVTRADFRAHSYRNLSLAAALKEHRLTGRLTSRDEALRFDFDLRGLLTRDEQQAQVSGTLRQLDLYGMHLIQQDFRAALKLDVSARATAAGTYGVQAVLDSIVLHDLYGRTLVPRTTIDASADPAQVTAKARSGDMKLDFSASGPIDSLIAGVDRVTRTATRQLLAQRLDMDPISRMLPPFTLDFSAGWNNALNEYLLRRNLSFESASIRARSADPAAFDAAAQVTGFDLDRVFMDTIRVALARNGRQLDVSALLVGMPDAHQVMSRATLDGYVVDSGATLRLALSKGRNLGFDIGMTAAYADSTIRVSLLPDRLVLGYRPWTVNEGNFVSYRLPDRRIGTDLRLHLTGDTTKHIIAKSVQRGDFPPGVRLDIARIEIAPLLELVPGLPAVSGRLNTDVMLAFPRRNIVAGRGNIGIDELVYNGARIGDLALRASYANLPRGHRFGADVSLDGAPVARAQGSYLIPQPPADSLPATLDAVVEFPGVPLAPVNAFLPEEIARLSGSLTGSVQAQGPLDSLRMEGSFRFVQAAADVPMVATRYRLTEDPIVLRDNVLHFGNLAILSPNDSRLRVAGQVDVRDVSQIQADIRLTANNFRAFHTARTVSAQLFGTALLDLDATVRGPVNALAVNATLGLLSGTDVTYVMKDSPIDGQVRTQDVVEFVPFTDTIALRRSAMKQVRPSSLQTTVQANINIANNVGVSVYLSDDGNNRAEVQGSGALTYTMNMFGDSRLMGRYTISGGQIRYSPPAISQKNFRIDPGGFVAWTGEIMNPTINLTAVESMRVPVSTEGQNRQVNFDISIVIRNALDKLEVAFDLAAPQDGEVQNELAGMTAEQRSSEAMSLLLTNTFRGTRSRTTAANTGTGDLLMDQANALLVRQLNSLSRNTLRGVDLSFGIDSYDTYTVDGQATSRTDYSFRLQQNFFNNRVRTVVGGRVSSDATPQTATDNLIDDISLEYMLNNRDNMYLRVFRHTGFESILEGEITTMGFGFVVSRKMMRMRELFRFSRKINPPPEPADSLFEDIPVPVITRPERGTSGRSPRRGDESGAASSPEGAAPQGQADSPARKPEETVPETDNPQNR